jgi:hypothetical protein
MDQFWNEFRLPEQQEHGDVEIINPADAYRKQAVAINMSGPLYAGLEVVEARLRRARRIEAEIERRILAQEADSMKGTQTRTNELVDAFILAAAENFLHKGQLKDVRQLLLKWRRRIDKLEAEKLKLERRLRALQQLAEICQKVLDFEKHLARLELAGVYRR